MRQFSTGVKTPEKLAKANNDINIIRIRAVSICFENKQISGKAYC